MRKIIITIMGVVCGAAIMMGVTVNHYQTEIKNLETSVESLATDKISLYADLQNLSVEYDELKSDKDELESQVYNLMNGDDYTIRINHDGALYGYSQKGKGLLKKTSKWIID